METMPKHVRGAVASLIGFILAGGSIWLWVAHDRADARHEPWNLSPMGALFVLGALVLVGVVVLAAVLEWPQWLTALIGVAAGVLIVLGITNWWSDIVWSASLLLCAIILGYLVLFAALYFVASRDSK